MALVKMVTEEETLYAAETVKEKVSVHAWACRSLNSSRVRAVWHLQRRSAQPGVVRLFCVHSLPRAHLLPARYLVVEHPKGTDMTQLAANIKRTALKSKAHKRLIVITKHRMLFIKRKKLSKQVIVHESQSLFNLLRIENMTPDLVLLQFADQVREGLGGLWKMTPSPPPAHWACVLADPA